MSDITDLLGVLWQGPSRVDNFVFKLHYRATPFFLILFHLLQGYSQFFGHPIHCITSDETSQSTVETYCWIHSTYTSAKHLNGTIGKNIIWSGIGANSTEEDSIHHSYYQWIPIIFFLQAISFLIPQILWKRLEGGRLEKFIKKPLKYQSDYIINNFNKFNLYFISYFVCEMFNLINVILQIYFLDSVLKGDFFTYGGSIFSMFRMDTKTRPDALSKTFPILTKCKFFKFGPSGTIVNIETLCVLPLNNVNEKLFKFLWFWFVVLFFMTLLTIVIQITFMISRTVRYYFLLILLKGSSRKQLNIIHSKSQVGDWFFIYQFGKVLSRTELKCLIVNVANKFEKNSSNKNINVII